jgi:mycothiol system anti-sigma-R factor
MECSDCVSRLWEYLDGELAAEEALALRCHLGYCRGCLPVYERDRGFLALLARCGAQTPSASATLRETIRLQLVLGG